LALAVASVVLVDAGALAGLPLVAHAAYLLGLATLMAALVRRVIHGHRKPPEEFLFLLPGFAFGIAGAVTLMAMEAGAWSEPQPRFAIRLMSLGMVLSLVLGIGSLLVPTFSGMSAPLEIPGLAGPHQRKPRRILYLSLGVLLVAAFALEAAGRPSAGATLRAVVGGVMVMWVWKLWRVKILPGVPARVLWSSGWLLLAGLVIAALGPAARLAGEHVAFIGGFGCITFGVATRVVASHGRHPIAVEAQVLGWPVAIGVLTAMALRVAAESDATHAAWLLGASGAAWAFAWIWWSARAVRLISSPRGDLIAVSKPRA
jgi:hypothetical protein